jgi:predicted MFS family arabinose efflux permease
MVFLVNLARVVFAPLIEFMAADFGVTAGSLGVVASAAWFGSALPRVPTGWLLTRVDRHHIVAGAGLVLTAAATLTGLAESVAAVTVGAFLMGLASGVYFIAANPLVAELFPEGVGRALGVHGMSSQLAAAGSSVLVIGVVRVLGDWQDTFRLVAVVAALTTAVLWLVARRTDLPNAGSRDRDLLAAVRAQLPIILTGVVITGSVGFVWNGLFNFYPTYMTTKGLDRQTASLLLSVVFAAGVPAFLLTGRLADRVSNVPLLLAVVGGFSACLFALPHATGLWPLVAVSVVLGYVIHSLFPTMDTYLLGTLPDHHRASAYTAYSASMMLPQAFGSGVVGSLTDAGMGFDVLYTAFGTGLAILLVALLALYATGRLPAGRNTTGTGA